MLILVGIYNLININTYINWYLLKKKCLNVSKRLTINLINCKLNPYALVNTLIGLSKISNSCWFIKSLLIYKIKLKFLI